MRCFVAIEISRSVRDRIVHLQDRPAYQARGVRWTDPKLIHLTLKFLGDVADEQAPSVCDAFERLGAGCAPFEVLVRGVGCFPPRGGARIVWIGVADPPAELMRCHRACEEALAELGFAKEQRAYHPHLTIGRVKDGRAGHEVREIIEAEATYDAGMCDVRELVLMESVLDRSGPTYTPLSRVKLRSEI